MINVGERPDGNPDFNRFLDYWDAGSAWDGRRERDREQDKYLTQDLADERFADLVERQELKEQRQENITNWMGVIQRYENEEKEINRALISDIGTWAKDHDALRKRSTIVRQELEFAQKSLKEAIEEYDEAEAARLDPGYKPRDFESHEILNVMQMAQKRTEDEYDHSQKYLQSNRRLVEKKQLMLNSLPAVLASMKDTFSGKEDAYATILDTFNTLITHITNDIPGEIRQILHDNWDKYSSDVVKEFVEIGKNQKTKPSLEDLITLYLEVFSRVWRKSYKTHNRPSIDKRPQIRDQIHGWTTRDVRGFFKK